MLEQRKWNYMYVECIIADVKADDLIYLERFHDEPYPRDHTGVHATVYSQRPSAMNIVYENGIEAYINTLRNSKLYKLEHTGLMRDSINNLREL